MALIGKSKAEIERDREAPAPSGWQFKVGGVYKKVRAPYTYFGVLTKCRTTSNGITTGWIATAGQGDEQVRADGSITEDWVYVGGGHPVE